MSKPSSGLLAVLVSLLALGFGPAHVYAGTVCGVVRDQLTSAPVSRAGVFVFTTAGSYTGLNAATDDSGAFCVGAVPPGTYDLLVRVNDYVAGVLRGVVVTGDVTGVGIDTRPAARLWLNPPWPNPSRGGVHLSFGSENPGALELSVVDAGGRLVRAWSSAPARAREFLFTWDLKDSSGRIVAPGIYFIRLTDGRESVNGRVVILH